LTRQLNCADESRWQVKRMRLPFRNAFLAVRRNARLAWKRACARVSLCAFGAGEGPGFGEGPGVDGGDGTGFGGPGAGGGGPGAPFGAGITTRTTFDRALTVLFVLISVT
jgi:hypothetical protein